ncbi:hypothetical protein IT072_08490 [Leifsonia sp. ZF2019]|uniref:hypothetical protein n=1 Tax=Leifsonia sp. ZF2019 TaxID=2781978 RepID=UPI001CBD450A|nr:hypothetical protein [Leifsonia sp. ZF2019]UAJ81012.1 hypothetical protein IT072_08490 [Leifsonia sp. ZF2019]
MFGRRRHAAAEVPAAPVPQLTDAQILEIVHGKIAALIGEDGEWTVSRRSADDTDTIFHSVLAQSVSVGIAAALVDARRRLEAGDMGAVTEPQHLAEPEETPAADSTRTADQGEPAAFSWEPAPITVWTDLRKPVTGEIPAIAERNAA